MQTNELKELKFEDIKLGNRIQFKSTTSNYLSHTGVIGTVIEKTPYGIMLNIGALCLYYKHLPDNEYYLFPELETEDNEKRISED